MIYNGFEISAGGSGSLIEKAGGGSTFVGFYSDKDCTNKIDISNWDGKTKIYAKFLDLKIVTWADGTDEEIVKMVQAADDGLINLGDYWNVGDIRNISLSAMSATGVGESHAAQTQRFVLMNKGGKTLSNGKECSFVVGMVDLLSTASSYEYGYMNSSNTNSGGWDQCARRKWCNDVFRNAIPSAIRGIFKQFSNVTANGSGSSKATSTDYFALPSEKEVFGSTTYADSTAESSNSQFEYYKTSSNRVKRSLDNTTHYWWERSPYSGSSDYFCGVNGDGSADYDIAYYNRGISPFGCI